MAWSWFATAASAAGMLGALGWIGTLIVGLVRGRSIRRLGDEPGLAPTGGWPSLAVVFAARDEAAEVEQATRSLLAQDYPGLQVIAVDDRSTDATGAILDGLAAEDRRLRVVHLDRLPEGWLGKTHALQAGADLADAAWLLFTDADITFAPGALRRAVALAERLRLDHLTAAPEMTSTGPGERVFMAMFCLLFLVFTSPWRVNDRRSKAALGAGALNLVRASAFRALGGFRRIALSVDDDLRLGQALKFAGYRNLLVVADRDLTLRWHAGLGGKVRGLEKNFFAVFDFRPEAVGLGVLALVVLGVMPHVGLFVGPTWARLICAGGVAALAAILVAARGLNGLAWYHALILPIGAAALIVALLRSVVLTLVRGGVRWRDQFYPLEALRRHVQRRNAWTRELWRSTR